MQCGTEPANVACDAWNKYSCNWHVLFHVSSPAPLLQSCPQLACLRLPGVAENIAYLSCGKYRMVKVHHSWRLSFLLRPARALLSHYALLTLLSFLRHLPLVTCRPFSAKLFLSGMPSPPMLFLVAVLPLSAVVPVSTSMMTSTPMALSNYKFSSLALFPSLLSVYVSRFAEESLSISSAIG